MTDHETPLSDDELLSAYLDGELAGDDLARAERLLAQQPGSRQLLAELRAIGDGLRKLAGGQLGEGFPQRVLRQAERQLLTESQVSITNPAAHSPARWRNKRPWIYAAATLAAGLLVAVVSWPQKSMKQPAAAADHSAVDRLANHAPAAEVELLHAGKAQAPATSAPASSGESMYPAAVAGSPSAPAAKPAAAPPPPEPQTGLRAALAQWGFAPQDADEIVEQLSAKQQNEQPLAEARPLIVWSLAVSADALEHEGLQRVLARHEVRVVEQLPLSLDRARLTDAASATPLPATPAAAAPPEAKRSGGGRQASLTPVTAVLATGSPQQLDATLLDLRSQSDIFRQVTELGRKSLPAGSLFEKRKSRPALQPGQTSGGQAGGVGQDLADGQAATEAQTSPRSRSMLAAQGRAELVLFILRRAEPASPASAGESSKAAKPPVTKPAATNSATDKD